MRKKVYCEDCDFWKAEGDGCVKQIGLKDTPYAQRPIYANPETDNKNNDCKYYYRSQVRRGNNYEFYKCYLQDISDSNINDDFCSYSYSINSGRYFE